MSQLFSRASVLAAAEADSSLKTFLLAFKSSTEPLSGNTSLTFLITLDRDLGDLMLLKLRWEGATLWRNVWEQVKTMIPWGGAEKQPLLTVGKISIKAGETQERYGFTLKSGEKICSHI